MTATPLDILQQYWQRKHFRPMQEAIILAVAGGADTLAIMPTGAGKSLCFQVPAMMREGICIVITPLIALMKDQVTQLEAKGIPALAIHSGMPFFEVQQTLEKAASGQYKFLYLSPERLATNLFKEFLPLLQVNLIAVDEAHCISQWGYDFRPSYLRIAEIRDALPATPVIALSASATPVVQDDIIQRLHFKAHRKFRLPFTRDNISYSVFNVSSKINKTTEILRQVPGSSIVYCNSRKACKEITELLLQENISAAFYHAGLTQEERSQRQEAWMQHKTTVMVCTNAFGMGIDKADVRTVIHFNAPDCLENYYQEAGRAGRDGKRSYAVLLYMPEDIHAMEALPDIRFPTVYDIRKVYQALADYLQVPVGIGEGNYYDFDLGEFARNFKLDIQQVISVLKILEQEGHLAFNENIFLPSQVCFIAEKALLEDFERSHPELEPLLKSLLRTYEGIYHNHVSVREKQLARINRSTPEKVQAGLMQLKSYGIIDYLPQKEKPQIYFMLNRAPAQFLHIDHTGYLQRKERYEQRLATMLTYITTHKDCRSQYIARYFGDETAGDCGICDTCLAKKRKPLTGEDLAAISQLIRQQIPEAGIGIKELLLQLKGVNKEKCMEVLHFLQAERMVTVDALGMVKNTP